MTPPKVLHIVDACEPNGDSLRSAILGLARSLNGLGMTSTVIAGAGTKAAKRADTNGGESRGPCDEHELERSTAGVNLMHIHGWGGAFCLRAARLALASKIPYIVSPIGFFDQTARLGGGWVAALRSRLSHRRLLAKAAAVAALNAYEQACLKSRRIHYQVPLLPYGVLSNESDSRIQPASSDRLLLMVGPIDPYEGCVMLLKAIAELAAAADGWSIVLAGSVDPERRKILEAAILRKGGAARVRLEAAPGPTEQAAWLARASVLAAPSLHVRCPVTFMQALIMGVPGLASDRVQPPGTESVVRSFSPTREALKEVLRPILRMTSEELAAWGRNTAGSARRVLDWGIRVRPFAELYRVVAR